MDIEDVWRLDATAQAALLRAHDVTASELVDAAIRRIEPLNPAINAVITNLYDDAIAAARATISSDAPPIEVARETIASDAPPIEVASDAIAADAPFAGVPMLVKDASLEIEGTPHYVGTRLLRDLRYRSSRTTELARRFRAAGFIFAGKTNVPELSTGISTEPLAFGPTRNPWSLDRTVGGSSGGSAAAVAAGMISIAHGADGTGSLRYPAACCGVVTLKPSRGLVPTTPGAGLRDDLQVWAEFVLARSVRDLAGMLDAVANRDRANADGYAAALGARIPRLRVGLLTHDAMAGAAVDAECVAAVEKTGALLASLGHDVEVSHPAALDGIFRRTLKAIVTVVAHVRYEQFCWLASIAGRELTQEDVDQQLVTADDLARLPMSAAEAEAAITREMEPINDWWRDGHDILVTPVLLQPPWLLGLSGGASDAGAFPGPFSFTGQPAMSVPMHWTPGGLPVGVQIVAARGRDDLVLQVAAQLEAAQPWADRWPPIAIATQA